MTNSTNYTMTNSSLAISNKTPPVHLQFAGWGLVVVALAGVITNLLLLVVFFKRRTALLKESINVFIISLSLSDLLTGLLGLPFAAVSTVTGRWVFGDAGCIWYAFSNSFFGLASINNIAMISIQRYLALCHEIKAKQISVKLAVKITSVVWLYSFVWAILPVLGWGKYGYEAYGTWCSYVWQEDTIVSRSFGACLMLFCFFIPLFIMIVAYIWVIKAVSRNLDFREPLSEIQRVMTKRQKNITVICVLISIAFFTAWTPYTVIALLHVAKKSYLVEAGGMWGYALPPVFAKTHMIYNPVIYFVLVESCRETLLQMFSCKNRIIDTNMLQLQQPEKINTATSSTLLPFPKKRTTLSSGPMERIQEPSIASQCKTNSGGLVVVQIGNKVVKSRHSTT